VTKKQEKQINDAVMQSAAMKKQSSYPVTFPKNIVPYKELVIGIDGEVKK
jgi:hypothetical protein